MSHYYENEEFERMLRIAALQEEERRLLFKQRAARFIMNGLNRLWDAVLRDSRITITRNADGKTEFAYSFLPERIVITSDPPLLSDGREGGEYDD